MLTPAEYQRWLEEEKARSARSVSGQPLVDFRTYEPTSYLEFQCTLDLRGRLYSHPCNSHLHLLDFIDTSGTRCNVTNLYVCAYTYPQYSTPLQPMNSLPGRRGAVDMYTLTYGFTYEICGPDQQRLKRFSFIYKDTKTLEPFFHD